MSKDQRDVTQQDVHLTGLYPGSPRKECGCYGYSGPGGVNDYFEFCCTCHVKEFAMREGCRWWTHMKRWRINAWAYMVSRTYT